MKCKNHLQNQLKEQPKRRLLQIQNLKSNLRVQKIQNKLKEKHLKPQKEEVKANKPTIASRYNQKLKEPISARNSGQNKPALPTKQKHSSSSFQAILTLPFEFNYMKKIRLEDLQH